MNLQKNPCNPVELKQTGGLGDHGRSIVGTWGEDANAS